MTQTELKKLHNSLIEDASILPDANFMSLINHIGEVIPVHSEDDRIERILGMINPNWNITFFESMCANVNTGKISEKEEAQRPLLQRLYNQFITENSSMYLLLLMLRYEALYEYGKTPACEDSDPKEYLKKLILSSDYSAKDDLLRLLDFAYKDGDPMIVCEEESPAEKLDKALMLLSLLTPKEISEKAYDRSLVIGMNAGPLGTFLEDDTLHWDKIVMFLLLGADQYSPLLQRIKLQPFRFDLDGIHPAEEMAAKIRELTHISCNKSICVDSELYGSLLQLCVLFGLPSKNIYDFSNEDTWKAKDMDVWIISSLDSKVENVIRQTNGRVLLTFNSTNSVKFARGDEFYSLRKYLIDNKYLAEVSSKSFEYDPMFTDNVCLFEISKTHDYDQVRFMNMDMLRFPDVQLRIEEYLWGRGKDNEAIEMISTECIQEEDYNLSMDIYLSVDLKEMQHPVSLSELLTPVEMASAEPSVVPVETLFIDSLSNDPLNNYNEKLKPFPVYLTKDDMRCKDMDVLVVNNTWPMRPTCFIRTDKKHDDIVIAGKLLEQGAMAYRIDITKISPWYLAYALSRESYQFNLRAQYGHISNEQFLKIVIDLPSLADQIQSIDKNLISRIDKIKKQLAEPDSLRREQKTRNFNLKHSIGNPSNRIQSLLGNLIYMTSTTDQSMCTQLKKIQDNYMYVTRIIDSYVSDFKSENNSYSLQRIIPLLERYLGEYSSLPFGLSPSLEVKGIDRNIMVKMNETYFQIMLDNIFKNAYIHGFNRNVLPSSKVLVKLSAVVYHGKDYLLLRIANNGNKMESNFAILDYVSEGKFGEKTGNTGIGGYDIYQIIKGMDGLLGLSSDEEWNFIEDILLPYDAKRYVNDKEEYENEGLL